MSNGTFTPEQFATRARAAGYRWAVLEMDDYGNAPRWPAFRDACYAHGLMAGVWYTDSWNLVNCPTDAKFVVGELESEGDYQGCLNAIGKLPNIPKAVITNFNPLANPDGTYRPDKAKPLIDAGYACITEAYLGESSTLTPPRLEHAARTLGWDSAQPCFGVYNYPLAGYNAWKSGGWSVYLGEYIL